MPDQGCYEEHYRLTYPVARGAAFSVVPLIIAIFSHQPLPWVILAPVAFTLAIVPWLVAVASRKIALRADMAGITLGADPLSWPFRHASALFVPWLLAVAGRKIAFRADMAGITLGADPLSWPFRHASAVFVPWSDAEAIALYQGGGPFGWRTGDDPCIAIQRRPGAPALSRGNKPARRCPLPGVAAGAVRPVTAWRLDRDRLAALTAAAAPGIPIIDAGTGRNQGVEGPHQAGNATRTLPADHQTGSPEGTQALRGWR